MIAKQRMEQTLNSNGNNNDADNDNDISRYLVEWRYSEEQGWKIQNWKIMAQEYNYCICVD